MAYTLAIDHGVNVQVSYVDTAGNPASIDGDVTWDVDPSGMMDLAVDANDSSMCTLTPLGPVGNCQVSASADADLGAGTKTLITLMDVTLVAGEAVTGTIAPTGEAFPLAPTATPVGP